MICQQGQEYFILGKGGKFKGKDIYIYKAKGCLRGASFIALNFKKRSKKVFFNVFL